MNKGSGDLSGYTLINQNFTLNFFFVCV